LAAMTHLDFVGFALAWGGPGWPAAPFRRHGALATCPVPPIVGAAVIVGMAARGR